MAKRKRKKKDEITLFTFISAPFKLIFCILYIIILPIVVVINKTFKFMMSLLFRKDKDGKKHKRKKFKAKKYYMNGEVIDYDALDGMDFEDFVADLIKRNGFNRVNLTQASSDYGVDIIAKYEGEKYVIQCKNYSTPVGNSAIQEVFAGMAYYDADAAAVVTNNYFTRNAIKMADKIGVELWDRDVLNRMIKSAMKDGR